MTKPQWVYGRPTEAEQSPDDSNSLVFDSAPLDHDLEILGYPVAKIRVSANVPVAQIAVRLTEVTPEGKSWLVSYNVLNLTRRDSMERPTALKSGEFYDIQLPLYMIAHRFKKGNRIRAALGELVAAGVALAADRNAQCRARRLASRAAGAPRSSRREAPFTIPCHPRGRLRNSGTPHGYANGLQLGEGDRIGTARRSRDARCHAAEFALTATHLRTNLPPRSSRRSAPPRTVATGAGSSRSQRATPTSCRMKFDPHEPLATRAIGTGMIHSEPT